MALIPAGECAWFLRVILQAGKEVGPIRLRTSWNAAGPADKGTSQVESLSCWGWRGGMGIAGKSRGTHS